MASKQLVWLITGTTSGIGKELTLIALERGDKVIATARNPAEIDPTLKENGAQTIQLDVTESLENLKKTAAEAIKLYGRVDVLVNNAGYVQVGSIEETTPEETLQQFNTNVFGALNLSRAFLPHMRERKSGSILFIGSVGGWRGFGGAGLYAGSKHAIRGLAESLDQEVRPLGIKVHCIEPGYFRTSLLAPDNRSAYHSRISEYDDIVSKTNDGLVAYNGKQPGDPSKLSNTLVDIVHGEGVVEGRGEVPVSLPFGSDAWKIIRGVVEETGEKLDEWKEVIDSTDFPVGQ